VPGAGSPDARKVAERRLMPFDSRVEYVLDISNLEIELQKIMRKYFIGLVRRGLQQMKED
jgi:hypothetical protein